MPTHLSADEALAVVQSNNRVFVQGGAAAPHRLLAAMTARAADLRDVEVVHLHTEGAVPYAAAEFADSFRVNALFVGANLREAIQAGRADYLPVFLSEVFGGGFIVIHFRRIKRSTQAN